MFHHFSFLYMNFAFLSCVCVYVRMRVCFIHVSKWVSREYPFICFMIDAYKFIIRKRGMQNPGGTRHIQVSLLGRTSLSSKVFDRWILRPRTGNYASAYRPRRK